MSNLPGHIREELKQQYDIFHLQIIEKFEEKKQKRQNICCAQKTIC